MEFLLIIITVTAVIILWPYVRIFLKRLEMATEISKCCKKNGYKLIKNHSLWIFGSKNGNKCDFYVETPNNVYSVKLWGMPNYKTKLCFTQDGKYYVKGYGIWLLFGGHFVGGTSSRPRPVSNYDFRSNFREEWYIKNFIPVLLVNPVCADIMKEGKDKNLLPVVWGESVNGASIYKITRLIGELEARQ
ncbi:MAG: hypothetical protein E7623_07770 [Ruminococcaceae bacterium]|nr:hypothetical protein [Oscillospiraceae bacterium]